MTQADKLQVLWIDDKYREMSSLIDYFDVNGIELHPFDNKDSAIAEFRKDPESWDAVILDIIGIDAEHIEDGSGMYEAKDDLRDIRKIPTFFFSGQDHIKEDKGYLMSLKKIYVKPDEEDELIHDIKEAAGKLKERKIKSLYPVVFNSIEYLGQFWKKKDDVYEVMMNSLKWLHFQEFRTSSYENNILNQMRSIADSIFTAFYHAGLLPEDLQDQYGQMAFDDCCTFLFGEVARKTYFDKDGPILNPIWKSHVLDIKFAGNSGSHGEKPDLSKNREMEKAVKDYRSISDKGLKSIVILMTCDLLIFAASYINGHPDKKDNMSRVVTAGRDTVTVEKDEEGNLHGGICLLAGPGLFPGRKVIINEFTCNMDRKCNQNYPLYGKSFTIVE